MADDRIDLQIKDEIQPSVITKLRQIAEFSRDADKRVGSMRKTVGAMGQVSSATARAGDEARKTADATRQWESATAKLNATNRQSVSTINSVSKSIANLSDEELKASAASNRAEASTIRYSMAQRRAQISSLSMDRATNRVNIDLLRSANAADRSKLSTIALSNAQIRNEQATRRMSSAQTRLQATSSGAFRSLTAYVGGGLLAREIFQLADGYTLLQNKIKVVTDSSAKLASVTEQVYDVANRTFAPVEATAQAFQRFDRAMSQLGATQQESIRLTETVNKTIQLSGANNGEAQSALLQLSQAFNKGKLDGDEFRTVMELMPDVADAIANRLGVVRGELLQLAPRGVITGKIMREALADAADEIDAKFAKMTPTMGQAFTTLRNSISQYIGEGNKAIGVTDSIADIALWASENIERLSDGIVILAGPLVIGAAIRGISALGVAVAANPFGALITATTVATSALVVFRDEISFTESGLITLGDQMEGLMRTISTLYNEGRLTSLTQQTANVAIERIKESRLQMVREVVGSAAGTAAEAAGAAAAAATRRTSGAGGGGRRQGSASASRPEDYSTVLQRNIEGIERQISSLQNLGSEYQIQNELERIRSEFIKNKISISEEDEAQLLGLLGAMDREKALHTELQAIYDETTGQQEKLSLQYDATALALERGLLSAKQYEDAVLAIDDAVIKAGADNERFSAIYDEQIVKQREIAESAEGLRIAYETQTITAREYRNEMMLLRDEMIKQSVDNEKFSRIYDRRIVRQRELQQSVDGLAEALRLGIISENEYESAVRDAGVQLFKRAEGSRELNQIIDESLGKYNELTNQIYAVARSHELGIVNAETYTSKMTDLRLEFAQLNLEMGEAGFDDVMINALDRVTDGFENMASSVADTMGGLFENLSEGFANSIGRAIVLGDDLGESLRNVARGAMVELIASIVKMGIQWVVTQALQAGASTAAMTATTAASVANASITAAAWAPAAAAASLASFGANSAPASAGLASTYALSSGLAQVKAFADGGYTGNMRTDDIAGFVHGQEYVIDAASVRRIGVANLDALRDGAANIQRPPITNNTTNNYNSDAGASGASRPEIRVINVQDPAMVSDYLNSEDGTDTMVNWINKNRESIF